MVLGIYSISWMSKSKHKLIEQFEIFESQESKLLQKKLIQDFGFSESTGGKTLVWVWNNKG